MTLIDKNSAQTSLAQKKLRAVVAQKKSLSNAMAWLDCGDFHLLFPSQDIVTLMPVQLMTPQTNSIAEVGYVDYDHHSVPVFCLSKSFQLQTQLDDAQKMIVLFKQKDIYFGLVARELTKITDESLNAFAVPVCMSSRKQPFTEFTIYQGRAAGISSASAIFNLLRLRGVKSLAADLAVKMQGAS